MDLTGKQKRFLRALAVNLKPIVQVGKGGVSNEILTSIRLACDARELVKVQILQNSDLPAAELAEMIDEMGIDVIQIIGRNLVVFKVAAKKEHRKISEELKTLKGW
ncbi:MAG: YhbY family RNA-binding protein [Streptococcaceae bacterium]|jgi:RNA-binding protein|nr:YhbY family RNA-binding protein [Streptococcaceae bacterium]